MTPQRIRALHEQLALSLHPYPGVGVPVLPAKLQGHPAGDAGLLPPQGPRLSPRLLRQHPGFPGFLRALRLRRGPGGGHGHQQEPGGLPHLRHR